MYNGHLPGGAINTGIPAAVIAVSSTGHGAPIGGSALIAVASINLALLFRAARQRSRSFDRPTPGSPIS